VPKDVAYGTPEAAARVLGGVYQAYTRSTRPSTRPTTPASDPARRKPAVTGVCCAPVAAAHRRS
jgi:hypothetical protein